MRFTYQSLFILATACVTFSCTKNLHPSSSKPYDMVSDGGRPSTDMVLNQPEIEIPQPDFVTIPDHDNLDRNTSPREQEAETPSYRFTEAELAHVKSSNYDPFPSGKSSFSIDLDDYSSKQAVYPCDGKPISAYGQRGRRMHSGTDIKGAAGSGVYAVFDGTVRLAKPYGGYGNVIVVRHDNGLETVYSHNARNLVKSGAKVKAGDKIATVGRTGSASTEHLHFEVRIKGQTINPALLLDFNTKSIQSGTLTVSKSGNYIKAVNRKSGVTASERPQQPQAPQTSAKDPVKETAQEQTTVKPQSSSAPKQEGASVYHTIVKGDTLYALALKYKTKVSSICSLNGISEKSVLRLGQKLKIK